MWNPCTIKFVECFQPKFKGTFNFFGTVLSDMTCFVYFMFGVAISDNTDNNLFCTECYCILLKGQYI